tara:strand:+ start:178 stop:471 length:294 start_codon:yes stop_codon:yes gene_type:complete
MILEHTPHLAGTKASQYHSKVYGFNSPINPLAFRYNLLAAEAERETASKNAEGGPPLGPKVAQPISIEGPCVLTDSSVRNELEDDVQCISQYLMNYG